jgi:cobalamin biosynthesis Mg chelatase CobN
MKKLLPFKMNVMKKVLAALTIAAAMVACNSKPQASTEDIVKRVADTLKMSEDTAGLAQFQKWKEQNEKSNVDQYGQALPLATAAVARTSSPARRTSSRTSTSRSGSNSGTMTSTSSNTARATQKKGWSKAAKGAVIGGVAGGVAGAVINKKNRVVGGVVGGVLGAGAGYGIGRHMDKKDGRY